MFNFPSTPLSEGAVVTEAQPLSANMAMTFRSVVDCTQLGFFSFHLNLLISTSSGRSRDGFRQPLVYRDEPRVKGGQLSPSLD